MKRRIRKPEAWWTGKIRSVDVGENLRLVPYWERWQTDPHKLQVVIDPGPSFGAGDHPTTLMALELLEAAVGMAGQRIHQPSLLDVGTGTGVLAIAGRLLGTGLTVGLDIDPAAIFIAQRNAGLNGMKSGETESGICLYIGGVEAVNARFHIVTANLAAPTLLRIAHELTRCTDHFLVLSGIAEAMAEEVWKTYTSEGLRVCSRAHRQGWHAALMGRELR